MAAVSDMDESQICVEERVTSVCPALLAVMKYFITGMIFVYVG